MLGGFSPVLALGHCPFSLNKLKLTSVSLDPLSLHDYIQFVAYTFARGPAISYFGKGVESREPGKG
jgi:hypothetical protein